MRRVAGRWMPTTEFDPVDVLRYAIEELGRNP